MRLLGLLLSLTLLCFTYACGNDAESVESGTEAGAAAHGVHIDSFTSTGWSSQTPQGEDSATASYNATAGSSGILYVKVTDSEGNPVDNADVYFQFTANESGAILKSLGGQTGERIKATTDKGGQAMAVYKAGYNLPDRELSDIVSATCNDSKMAIIIYRLAGSYPGLIISVTADQDSLKAGENTIIKAKVTNATGVVIGGQAVTFTLAENNSGATLRTLGTGVTDAGGEASAVYKAGATSPTKSVQDTVQAAVPDAAGAVFITRLANTAIIGCRMTLTADRTSLDSGKSTILRATVLNGDGKPYTGNIKFEFLTNSSSGTLSPSSAQTNSNGVATTVYKAGAEGSGAVEDIIKASATQCCTGDDCCTETLCCTEAGCCSETIIITRSGQPVVTPTGYRITMTAGKNSLTAGETTIVTAKVTDGSSVPVKGQVVNFAFVSSPSGATLSDIDAGTSGLTTATGVTDASGEAIVGYTAGSSSSTLAVQDIIQASVTGATGALILTRTAAELTPTGRILSLTAVPSSVYPGNMSELTATVTYTGDISVGANVPVTFTIAGQNNSGANLTGSSGTGEIVSTTTDGSGQARVSYIAGSTPSTDGVTAYVTTDSGVSATTYITVTSGTTYVITLEQDPVTSEDNYAEYHKNPLISITAKVRLNGQLVTDGSVSIDFAIVNEGTFNENGNKSISATLDGEGKAVVTFALPIPPEVTPRDKGKTEIRACIGATYCSPTFVYWEIWGYDGP